MLKKMNFVVKMMDFVVKMMDFVLNMMTFQAPPMKKHEEGQEKHAMKMVNLPLQHDFVVKMMSVCIQKTNDFWGEQVNSGARSFVASLRGGVSPKSNKEETSVNADGSWKAPPPQKDDKPGAK